MPCLSGAIQARWYCPAVCRRDACRGAVRRPLVALAAAAEAGEDTDDRQTGPSLGHDTDVVVIGAGVSGLCAAAALATQGVRVTVVEAHSVAGGAAHGFTRQQHHFDSGPSFFFGLSDPAGTSLNALSQTLDALGERVPCATYSGWQVYTPQGTFACTTSLAEYETTIRRFAGEAGLQQWRGLRDRLTPLSNFAGVLPFAALRGDPGVALSMARFAPGLARGFADLAMSPGGLGSLSSLSGSFGDILRLSGVTSPWLRALIELETFVISGQLAAGTPAPEMAFVLSQRFREGAVLDHPIGGCQSLIDALTRGIVKHGGRVCLRAPVEQVVVSNGRARGVRLAGNKGVITASQAVISSLSAWDLPKVLPASILPSADVARAASTPECGSFVHLHLGFDATGLDLAALGIHHLVVNDFRAEAITGDRNVINISIPSALDSTLAPPGQAVAHVYCAANEPFDDWAGLTRGSPQYDAMKAERSECLWLALERVIPDIRARATLPLVGTPLTHARYLRRHRGSYGPALPPDQWPGPGTALPGLLRCGDSTFPGIGVPAAAASGLIAANTCLSIPQHWSLLDAMGRR